jgi:hypothetical protein
MMSHPTGSLARLVSVYAILNASVPEQRTTINLWIDYTAEQFLSVDLLILRCEARS